MPQLGVPYYPQEQDNYCVPASIAMWRGYDGLPPVSQDQIWDALGGAPCYGDEAALGVRMFTSSGYDAFHHVVAPWEKEEFLARQLTSVDLYVPVIVTVGSLRNHVVIIAGGRYQFQASTERYTWNTVLFHDPNPRIGKNNDLASNLWLNYTCDPYSNYCEQVVSRSASDPWYSHLQVYGFQVDLYDGSTPIEENRD